MQRTITDKQRQRRYTLHYLLRKKNNCKVNTKERMVIKRQTVTSIEDKWLEELRQMGYGICEDMFMNETNN